ncbi:MAG: hypothetical protein IPM07_09760 [Anaerolineales bacterium]|nr:hypothetical protein [Anaerolineales bacterium]
MAKRVTAINTYRTRIQRGPIVEPTELAHFVAERENLSPSDVTHALLAIGDAALYLLRTGRSVRLAGVGMLTPSVDMAGTFSARLVFDRKLLRHARPAGKAFLGEFSHAEHRHRSPDELVALWNAEHPDDAVEE